MSNSAEFDRFAEDYDQRLNRALAASGESKDFFARGRVEWLAQRLREIQLSPRSAIDYGCGTGDTTALLREILPCESVIGLDVSARSLDKARRAHGSASRFLTFEEYAPDASADVVYCNGVFHHIPPAERAEAVHYIFRCLCPGGVFGLWENNPWNPGTQLVMCRCDFDRRAIKIFPREAAGLLAGNGFKILGTDFRFFFPRLLKALRPLEESLLRIPLGGQYLVLGRKPVS